MQTAKTYQAHIFIGAAIGYSANKYLYKDLRAAVQEFQIAQKDFCGVTITDVEFVVGEYVEEGYQISTINYPRFPKDPGFIRTFMISLGNHLLRKMEQNRLSVVFPDYTYMLESPDAEAHPPKPKA